MARRDGSNGRRALMDVEERFRSWRSSRRRGEKIPRELWQAVVELADGHTLDEIASTLALNRERLEKQVRATARTRERARTAVLKAGYGGFVEVEASSPGYPDECTVESEDGSGRKLTMHLKGDGCRHALEISKAFWDLGR